MKTLVPLLLVIFLWCNSNALRCVNGPNPVFFTADNVTEAKELVSTLETTDEHMVCYMIYLVDFAENTFLVDFAVHYNSVPGDLNMDVYTQMELILASDGDIIDPATGYRSYYFKCDDEDACERNFWRNHVDFFVVEGSTLLEQALRSVLITEIQEKVQCVVQEEGNSGTCESDGCFFDNVNGGHAGCAEQDLRKTSINVGILFKFSVNTSEEYGLSVNGYVTGPDYVCQYDQCNNRETYSKVWEATINSPNLGVPALTQALSTTLRAKKTTTPETGLNSTSTEGPKPEDEPTAISAASTSSTSKQTTTAPTNNSILYYLSMNIVILHCMFLIFF